jgi:CRP-like cAMP-binding protein
MYSPFESILLLKKSSIFSDVNTEDLTVVARALEGEAFFEGDRIFEIDDHGDYMYILLNGKIGISISPKNQPPEFIAELGTGECFGEMGMLDDQPRSASAYALEDTKVLRLGKTKLRGLISRYPELAFGILRSLSLRLRAANTRENR